MILKRGTRLNKNTWKPEHSTVNALIFNCSALHLKLYWLFTGGSEAARFRLCR